MEGSSLLMMRFGASNSAFARSLRAELTKLRALRTVRVLSLLQAGGLVLFAVASILVGPDGGVTDLGEAVVYGADTVPLFSALIGVIAFSGEFAQGSTKYALLACPRRATLLGGKAMALVIVLGVSGMVGAAGAIGAVATTANFVRGAPRGTPLADPAALGAYIVVSILYGLLGLAIGAAVRSVAGSVFALLGILWGLPVAAAVVGIWLPLLNDLVVATTPAALTVELVHPASDWIVAVLGFLAWPAALLILGWARLRPSALR